jgi:hypothetical protein
VLARFAALGLVLTATSLAASTPARAQSPAPPAAPPAAADGVLVHIATPAEVDLEVQRGRDWVPICTSPCDRLVRPGESYRVSSDHVPTSNVFAIAPAPRVTLHVDPSTKQSRIGGVILIVLGGVGLVPAGVVTLGVATFFLGAVILVCPIAAGSNSSYGNCVAGAPGLVTPLYGSPYVSIPGLVGAVLAAAGAAWLAATSGGHPTNVTTALALPRPAPALAALPAWNTLTRTEGALPPPAVVPLMSGTF